MRNSFEGPQSYQSYNDDIDADDQTDPISDDELSSPAERALEPALNEEHGQQTEADEIRRVLETLENDPEASEEPEDRTP